MVKVICPYKEKHRRICTHIGCKPNGKSKRTCSYQYPHNCELFIDWVEKNKKFNPDMLKTSGVYTGEEI